MCYDNHGECVFSVVTGNLCLPQVIYHSLLWNWPKAIIPPNGVEQEQMLKAVLLDATQYPYKGHRLDKLQWP